MGKVVAQHFTAVVRIPLSLDGKPIAPAEPMHRTTISGMGLWRFDLSDAASEDSSPLFPESSRTLVREINLDAKHAFVLEEGPMIEHAAVTIYADQMPRLELARKWTEVANGWSASPPELRSLIDAFVKSVPASASRKKTREG